MGSQDHLILQTRHGETFCPNCDDKEYDLPRIVEPLSSEETEMSEYTPEELKALQIIKSAKKELEEQRRQCKREDLYRCHVAREMMASVSGYVFPTVPTKKPLQQDEFNNEDCLEVKYRRKKHGSNELKPEIVTVHGNKWMGKFDVPKWMVVVITRFAKGCRIDVHIEPHLTKSSASVKKIQALRDIENRAREYMRDRLDVPYNQRFLNATSLKARLKNDLEL